MPITFACNCGKTLRVKDDHAGKWVRCPSCKDTALVPEAEPQPAFEVVEDEPPPPPQRARVRAEPAEEKYGVRDDDEDDRPRRRRPVEDDDDRPRRRKKRPSSRPKKDEKPGHFAMEKGVMNGGVAGGLLAMIGAVVWFVVGLMNDIIFYYPPVLFILGLVGFFKGLVGGGGSDD